MPTSSSGVTSANHCGKPGALTSWWNRTREVSSSLAASGANRSVAAALCRSTEGAPASSVAAATCSMWRAAITGSPYRAKMTSPCSVSLNRPSTEPGGWASRARLAGPPPRPSAPPRPWNSVSTMSCRFAQSVMRRCAASRVSVAETGPTSFDESE